MVFNSLEFLIFFAAVYFSYLILRHRAQNAFLLAASYVFYGWWNWKFLSLILISTIVDYCCARRIRRCVRPAARKGWLILSICVNLGILGFFKYFNFFAENLGMILESAGIRADVPTLNIILPLGISFYTFQTMSYTIDVYRGKFEPVDSFGDFALYVAFFPQLVAGPIERAQRLIPQILRPRTITPEDLKRGLFLIGWGLFLKVCVADNLGLWVDEVFAAGARPSGMKVLTGLYAFAFQILGDFEGYSCMAVGVARLMGFRLITNFNLPYFSLIPSEFWRRWHISLSEWLRDYLYVPLGGNRGGAWILVRNLMIVMFLGGLWHGASWHFVLWGLYHGAFLVVYHLLSGRDRKALRGLPFFLKCLMMLLWFHIVCYGWLIFRVTDLAQLGLLTRQLFFDFTPYPGMGGDFAYCAFFIFVPLIVQSAQYLAKDLLFVTKARAAGQYLFWTGLFYFTVLVLIFGKSASVQGGNEFIYFQF